MGKHGKGAKRRSSTLSKLKKVVSILALTATSAFGLNPGASALTMDSLQPPSLNGAIVGVCKNGDGRPAPPKVEPNAKKVLDFLANRKQNSRKQQDKHKRNANRRKEDRTNKALGNNLRGLSSKVQNRTSYRLDKKSHKTHAGPKRTTKELLQAGQCKRGNRRLLGSERAPGPDRARKAFYRIH